MGEVVVSILGKSYKLFCDDGQESRIEDLAVYLEGYAKKLKATFSNVTDDQLFLMTGLVIADKLWEIREGKAGDGAAGQNEGTVKKAANAASREPEKSAGGSDVEVVQS